MTSVNFKKTKLYRELRYLYRALIIYKIFFSYIYFRFLIGPKLKKLKHPLDNPPGTDKYTVHLLCSHDDILMMLWSLASWHQAVPSSGKIYIHEDGSFTKFDRELIARLLPRARIVDYQDSKQKIPARLRGYPHSMKFRMADDEYIFAIKLIDPFFASNAPARLILDTDLLWFKKPQEMLDLLCRTQFMMKSNSAMEYRYADGRELPFPLSNANSGVVGYQVFHFDLNTLEEFCRRNGEHNPSRVIEQAGFAYVLKPELLDESKYSLKNREGQIVRHYTGPVREQFWFEGVKKVSALVFNS